MTEIYLTVSTFTVVLWACAVLIFGGNPHISMEKSKKIALFYLKWQDYILLLSPEPTPLFLCPCYAS